ncbi:hypothetical protein F4781DRAFT_426720 [Annulohypoxylon bovei var. microspora]|nr:hypothetical protein F4781DRAFT_426720 [Annulohypoxylon bovei var. microspora]
MDPLSVAGLALTALDQLWKISERTAELVSNFRDFDHDTKILEAKIKDDNTRTKALRQLLFDPSTIYQGQSLFEQFDSEVQNHVQIFFEQAIGIIEQAHQLLSRRQASSSPEETGLVDNLSRSSTPSISILIATPNGSNTNLSQSHEVSKKPSRTFQRLRWSLLDKKRVEAIVREFSEVNKRIYDNIKLWCLGTSIGVDLQHLRHLEQDTNSRTLGFDVDARLQLAASTEQILPGTLEVQHSEDARRALYSVVPVEEKFGVLQWDSKPMLVEYRSYAPESPVPVEMDSRTHDLVDKLAKLLCQPKEVVFRTPSCWGWARQMQFNRVAFMFSVPEGSEAQPKSLYHILGSSSQPPSLGQRFALALQLARCISHLQLVKWVHKSFRSENVLFFPPKIDKNADPAPTPEESLDFSEPWVLGYEFSRPEAYFSQGQSDRCPTRDVYRHPDRQGRPTQLFNKVHDIYSLGVVLLEIGLWQQATSLEKSGFANVRDPQAIKKHLVRHAEKRLASKMGEKYRQVVLTCLENRFDVKDDSKGDLKLQQAFRILVINVLENATKYI